MQTSKKNGEQVYKNKQDEKIDIIRKTIRRFLPENYELFLFGSRARETHRENSDYDIGIQGPQKVERTTLLKLRSTIQDLPILVDIVDFMDSSEEFLTIAKKEGMKKI